MYRFRHPGMRQEADTILWGRVSAAFLLSLFLAGALVAWAWTMERDRTAELRPDGRFPEREIGPRRDIGFVRQEPFDSERVGQKLVAEQREALSRFGRVDPDRGVVSIPIDDAIELVAGEVAR